MFFFKKSHLINIHQNYLLKFLVDSTSDVLELFSGLQLQLCQGSATLSCSLILGSFLTNKSDYYHLCGGTFPIEVLADLCSKSLTADHIRVNFIWMPPWSVKYLIIISAQFFLYTCSILFPFIRCFESTGAGEYPAKPLTILNHDEKDKSSTSNPDYTIELIRQKVPIFTIICENNIMNYSICIYLDFRVTIKIQRR